MRSSHRKSRLGCRECKKRHMKCDETRPSCNNCTKIKRECSFALVCGPEPSLVPIQPRTRDEPLYCQAETVAPKAPRSPGAGLSQHRGQDLLDENYSIIHLQLLHHADNELSSDIQPFVPNARNHIKLSVREAFSSVYLMDALIAVAAAHKSTLPGEDQNFYRNEATKLFARSVTKFKNQKEINEDCASAAFLFTSFLGQLVLFDIFSEDGPFISLLDRLVHCIKLHQGIRNIVGPVWHKIQPQMSCELGEWVSDGRVQRAGPNCECYPLWEMLGRSDIGSYSRTTYVSSIEALQGMFDSANEVPTRRMQVAQEWLVRIPVEFTEFISQRRPESLVILAYYGVLLHQARHFWAVGNAGRQLIESITVYLGAYWSPWLRWPNESLDTPVSYTR